MPVPNLSFNTDAPRSALPQFAYRILISSTSNTSIPYGSL
jgi:hypothetical protein